MIVDLHSRRSSASSSSPARSPRSPCCWSPTSLSWRRSSSASRATAFRGTSSSICSPRPRSPHSQRGYAHARARQPRPSPLRRDDHAPARRSRTRSRRGDPVLFLHVQYEPGVVVHLGSTSVHAYLSDFAVLAVVVGRDRVGHRRPGGRRCGAGLHALDSPARCSSRGCSPRSRGAGTSRRPDTRGTRTPSPRRSSASTRCSPRRCRCSCAGARELAVVAWSLDRVERGRDGGRARAILRRGDLHGRRTRRRAAGVVHRLIRLGGSLCRERC